MNSSKSNGTDEKSGDEKVAVKFWMLQKWHFDWLYTDSYIWFTYQNVISEESEKMKTGTVLDHLKFYGRSFVPCVPLDSNLVRHVCILFEIRCLYLTVACCVFVCVWFSTEAWIIIIRSFVLGIRAFLPWCFPCVPQRKEAKNSVNNFRLTTVLVHFKLSDQSKPSSSLRPKFIRKTDKCDAHC